MIVFAAILAWLVGFILLWRIDRADQEMSQIRRHGTVSLVIPARNNEHNLQVLLQSIKQQPIPPLEVIVVDEGSTDRTAEVARQLGAKVIQSKSLPEGWLGKTWACQQGAVEARGDLLLFIDADTWFEPDGLEAIFFRYESGVLSIGPYHLVNKPYEQLSAFFNLVMTAGTTPDGLFDQMLLVDRKSYDRLGGHKAVRGQARANSLLAKICSERGIPVRSLAGNGVLTFRMYPDGYPQLLAGWKKEFASGAQRASVPILLLAIVWLTGMLLPLGMFSIWGLILYVLYVIQLSYGFRQIGSFAWYTALVYPVPLFFFLYVSGSSAVANRRARRIRMPQAQSTP